MTQLTDIQTKLLTTAAESADGSLPAADFPRATSAALIRRGMLISVPRPDGDAHLLITEAGRAAIRAPAATSSPNAPTVSVEPSAKPKGKIDTLVEMMGLPGGATTEAMMQATGWQAHSVRGAIAGAIKKTLGHAVISEKLDGVRTYRIAAAADA